MSIEAKFSDLVGEKIDHITGGVGDDRLTFNTASGKEFLMHHYQNCYESVSLYDVIGDLSDIVGEEILEAEEATSDIHPDGYEREYCDSFTWTFYKIRTRKGGVTLRWLGESNGYYSESVYFERTS